MNKWNCELVFKDNNLIIDKRKKVKLETNKQDHIILQLLDAETEIIKIRDTFFSDCNDNELKQKLKKIHVMTAHKQEDTLIKFLQGSNNYNPKIKQILSEVIKECVTCRRMRRTPDKPRVSLPKVSQPNEIL